MLTAERENCFHATTCSAAVVDYFMHDLYWRSLHPCDFSSMLMTGLLR